MIVGIDPSSKTLAVVTLASTDAPTMSQKPMMAVKHKLRGSGRWNPSDAADVYGVVITLAVDALELGPDDYVYLEEPVVGRAIRATIVQSYVSGIVQAVAATSGAEVVLVNNKTWKKVVIGNGNATKEDTKRVIRAINPSAARLCGDDDDLYDATGLALYGASSVRGL